MVCIATIVSVFVINLARNQHVTPLPWLLKNLLTGWLGQILCLGYVTGQVQCIHPNSMLAESFFGRNFPHFIEPACSLPR
jgi:hypothetical protein